jgi:serine/threonine protein kinase
LLIEAATGKFPYHSDDKKLTFWDLKKRITENASPTLPKDKAFSKDFNDFISICLRKCGGTRGSATQLLLHPFV